MRSFMNRLYSVGARFFFGAPAFDPEAAVYGSERHYVQGFVNLLENTPLTGGNVVIPGSHRMFVEMLEQGVQTRNCQGRTVAIAT